MSVKNTFRKIGGFISNNQQVILTSLGVAGVVTTSVLTATSTIKAYDIWMEDAIDNGAHEEDPKEIVKMVWKAYIPPLTVGVMTIAVIIGAHQSHGRKNAALASMYTLSEATMSKYQEKVAEQIGSSKEKTIREEVSNEMISEEPREDGKNVHITGNGDHLCYDVISGRYFRSDIESVRKAQNDMNHDLFSDMWGSLNDFYRYLDIPSIKIGDDIGWNIEKPIDIQFSSTVTEKGEPCLVIDHDNMPDIQFRDW